MNAFSIKLNKFKYIFQKDKSIELQISLERLVLCFEYNKGQIQQQMKIQASIKQWATKVMGYQVNNLNQVQNAQFIIKILHKIEPSSFRSDWTINQRSSNSLNNIMYQISSYYKRELGQNISHFVDNINVFKNVIQVWELLVGIAVKGKNRDNNINIILQMQQSLQSQLMSFVQQIIQKFGEDVYDQNLSNTSGQNQRKRSSSIQQFNQTNQMLAELMQQVQTLKQKNVQLITQMDIMKFTNEQAKKAYQSKIEIYKNERYDFLQVITNYNGQSKSKILGSSTSNDSDDLCFSVTGSLSQIACDLLNVIKQLKKQSQRQTQKVNLLEQVNKDLKQAYHRISDENNELKREVQNHTIVQGQLQKLRFQNIKLQKNENDLIKKINQIQEQKFFLREIIQKNKIQNQNRLKNQNIAALNNQHLKNSLISQENNIQKNKSANLDFLKIPKAITNTLSQISESGDDGQYLSKEIDQIRQPLIRNKLQKQIKYLKQSIQQLKQQNESLKSINFILQDAIHQSAKKTSQINDCLNEEFNKFLVQQSNKSYQILNQTNIGNIQNKNKQEEELPQLKFTIKVSYQQKQVSSEQFIISDKQLSPKKSKNNQQEKLLHNENNNKVSQNKTSLNQIQQQKLEQIEQKISLDQKQHKNSDQKQYKNNQKLLKQKQKQKMNLKQHKSSDQHIKKLYLKTKQIVEKYQNRQLILRIQLQALKKQINILQQQNYKIISNASQQKLQLNKNYQIQKSINQAISSSFQLPKTQNNSVFFKNQDNSQYQNQSQYKIVYSYQNQHKIQSQFNQIKQGEDLNQNQLTTTPRVQIKSHIFNMNSQIVHDMVQKNIQKSTLQFLRPKRISSYKQSFIQLNNRLQSQLEGQVQNLMSSLKTRVNNQNQPQSSQIVEQTQRKKKRLLQSLEQIYNSTQKISKMYQQYLSLKDKKQKNQAQKFISQLQQIRGLKERLENEEIVSLKILNQGLKMLLNEMFGQKEAIYEVLKNIKKHIFKPSQTEQTLLNLFQSLQSIQHLKIGPQMQTIMGRLFECQKQQKQKIQFYEKLYMCQKQKKESLQIQINLLMESMVFFRNIALDD